MSYLLIKLWRKTLSISMLQLLTLLFFHLIYKFIKKKPEVFLMCNSWPAYQLTLLTLLTCWTYCFFISFINLFKKPEVYLCCRCWPCWPSYFFTTFLNILRKKVYPIHAAVAEQVWLIVTSLQTFRQTYLHTKWFIVRVGSSRHFYNNF